MTGRRSTFMAVTSPPKALVFDVFGTVVDRRTSITRKVQDLAGRKGLRVDAAKFADAWRAGYMPSTNRIRAGELPWTKLDDLHRRTLEDLAGQPLSSREPGSDRPFAESASRPVWFESKEDAEYADRPLTRADADCSACGQSSSLNEPGF